MVSSVIFFAVVCWGSRLMAAESSKRNTLVRKAGDVVGVRWNPKSQWWGDWYSRNCKASEETPPTPSISPWCNTEAHGPKQTFHPYWKWSTTEGLSFLWQSNRPIPPCKALLHLRSVFLIQNSKFNWLCRDTEQQTKGQSHWEGKSKSVVLMTCYTNL